MDAISATDIIYFAGFEFNDIKNRLVVDLGSGTGRLSIASAFLGANNVISVDIDWDALVTLKSNIQHLELEHVVFPICADMKNFQFSNKLAKRIKITTIMNPPFGVKKKAADRVFLLRAFSFSHFVYSIHLAG